MFKQSFKVNGVLRIVAIYIYVIGFKMFEQSFKASLLRALDMFDGALKNMRFFRYLRPRMPKSLYFSRMIQIIIII